MTERLGALTLSVVAPAFNEADNLSDVISDWVAYLSGCEAITTWEIVVCDDGSTDDSPRVLTALAERHRELAVVTHPTNRGAAAALVSAIGQTSHAWVVLIDSDRQFALEDLDAVVSLLATDRGECAYTGVRARKADHVFYRWGSAVSGAAFNLAAGTRLRDVNSIFKVVPGEIVRSVRLEAVGLNLSAELTATLLTSGIRWEEFPVRHRPRTRGTHSGSFVRDALRRAAFVVYLALRLRLLRYGVLTGSHTAAQGTQ